MRAIVAAFASLLALPVAASAQMPDSTLSTLVLSPGDALRIEVFRNKELSGEFPIAADGSITHPLYHELKVGGLPLPRVEDMLRQFIARFEENPAFVMTPLLRVIVAGEVRQPNIYTVPPGTSVSQAVAMAGGPTDRGKLDQVRVLRRRGSLTLDLTRPDGSASLVAVHSGDEILLGRRRNIMQDYVAPVSSILGAAAAVAGLIVQLGR